MDLAGLYRDGKSARDQPVRVRLLGHGLDIVDADGRVLAQWPRPRLRRVDGADGLRLGCDTQPLARLVLADPGPLLEWLPRKKSSAGLWLGLVGGAAAMVALLAWGLPRAATGIARLVPVETERQWGRAFVAQVETGKTVCLQQAGLDALARLERRLAAALPAPQRPTRVLVMNDPLVNAVALPGGTVILFRGLLEQAESADELAGVLAHEMAHVAQRHPLAAAIRSVGVASLATLITGDVSALVASLGGMALAGHYSRADESAADSMATTILAQAAISPQGLAAFFGRLRDQGRELPEFLSSHPELEARRRAILAAPSATAAHAALDQAEFRALQAICAQPAGKNSTP